MRLRKGGGGWGGIVLKGGGGRGKWGCLKGEDERKGGRCCQTISEMWMRAHHDANEVGICTGSSLQSHNEPRMCNAHSSALCLGAKQINMQGFTTTRKLISRASFFRGAATVSSSMLHLAAHDTAGHLKRGGGTSSADRGMPAAMETMT